MVFLSITSVGVILLTPFARSSFICIDSLRRSLLWLRLLGVIIYLLRADIVVINAWLGGFIVLSLLIAFISVSLLLFYIMFELSVVPILLAIVFFGSQPERVRASTYFLVYTMLVSLPFLVLISSLSGVVFIAMKTTQASPLIALLIIFPFLVKIPIIGFHYWLPKAHVEARTGGSIILAGLLLKLGRYGIFRLCDFGFCLLKQTRLVWVFLSLIAGFLATRQTDVKKIIAYSRVVHITIMVLSLSSAICTFPIILLISLAHGGASMLLFFSFGALRTSRGSRLMPSLALDEKFSWISYLVGISLVINASIPPAISFVPELLLVVCVFGRRILLFIVFAGIRILVCYYNVILLKGLLQTKSAVVLGGANGCFVTVLSYGILTSLSLVLWTQSFFKLNGRLLLFHS